MAKRKPPKAAREELYLGAPEVDARPLVFLDFDDVLYLHHPYGARDVFAPDQPADLYERLWHPPAVQTLLVIMEEFNPRVVITSSWLRLMERDGFVDLFRRTGLGAVADALHDAWEAPQNRGTTRLNALQKWLVAHYQGERLVVLDDEYSGTGLRGSRLERAGCVVWCEVGVGLHAGHLPAVRRALQSSGAPNGR